ncbi:unnamed protein product [Cercospora beticola]|nr:unnamed protein product [Cercospora beticola]
MAERIAPAVTDTLKDLLGDGRYADLTVTCGQRKWRVHKNIVCTRCTFFEKAVDGRFAESKTDTVDLKDNHPNAVAAMIRYLYTDDLDDSIHATDDDGEWKQLAMTVQVHKIGDQFGLKRLADLATAKFEACLKSHAHNAPGFLETIEMVSTPLM